MNQLQIVVEEIYKPHFDVEKDEFVDKSPYLPYERRCVRYECRCRAGSCFTGNAQFKQHTKSKTHKDFILFYKKYYKEADEALTKYTTLLAERELLARKNETLVEENRARLETIKEHEDEFQECMWCYMSP